MTKTKTESGAIKFVTSRRTLFAVTFTTTKCSSSTKPFESIENKKIHLNNKTPILSAVPTICPHFFLVSSRFKMFHVFLTLFLPQVILGFRLGRNCQNFNYGTFPKQPIARLQVKVPRKYGDSATSEVITITKSKELSNNIKTVLFYHDYFFDNNFQSRPPFRPEVDENNNNLIEELKLEIKVHFRIDMADYYFVYTYMQQKVYIEIPMDAIRVLNGTCKVQSIMDSCVLLQSLIEFEECADNQPGYTHENGLLAFNIDLTAFDIVRVPRVHYGCRIYGKRSLFEKSALQNIRQKPIDMVKANANFEVVKTSIKFSKIRNAEFIDDSKLKYPEDTRTPLQVKSLLRTQAKINFFFFLHFYRFTFPLANGMIFINIPEIGMYLLAVIMNAFVGIIVEWLPI